MSKFKAAEDKVLASQTLEALRNQPTKLFKVPFLFIQELQISI